jgi:ATP-binding cassette subfamily B protein
MSEKKKNRRNGDGPNLIGRRHPGMRGGPEARAEDARGTLLRLWGYLRRQKWTLLAVLALVVLTTVLGVIGPYLMGIAIDRFIATGDLSGLARIALLMLSIYYDNGTLGRIF